MESAEELQQQEITALQSIYAEEFIESPPPKAWKVCVLRLGGDFDLIGYQGAVRLPEFIIKVPHPDPQYAHKIYFHLNTKYFVCCCCCSVYQLIVALKVPEDVPCLGMP